MPVVGEPLIQEACKYRVEVLTRVQKYSHMTPKEVRDSKECQEEADSIQNELDQLDAQEKEWTKLDIEPEEEWTLLESSKYSTVSGISR